MFFYLKGENKFNFSGIMIKKRKINKYTSTKAITRIPPRKITKSIDVPKVKNPRRSLKGTSEKTNRNYDKGNLYN